MMTIMDKAQQTADKTRLRMFREEDSLLIHQWRNDPAQIRYMQSQFRYVSLELEREWVRSKMTENVHEIYLAICLNDESQRMIGYLSLNRVNYVNRSAELGALWIGDADYRHGAYISEALHKVLCYAYGTYNLERVFAYCLTEHGASIAQFLSMGFGVEGRLRHSVLKDGQWHDEYLLALLRDDFYALTEAGAYAPDRLAERRTLCRSLSQQGEGYEQISQQLAACPSSPKDCDR